MKFRRLLSTQAVLLAALAISVQLIAQDHQSTASNRHHRYRLIDLGTFGGPSNWFCNDPNLVGGACAIQNNRGMVVSGADTSLPNPNYQNPNIFFPPFTVPGDPYIQHAYQWQGGALQDLGALPGGYNSWAQAVSANGLVAGLSENGGFDPLFGVPAAHAILWKNGGQTIVDLGTLEGGYESLAFGVNSRGQVIGNALNTIPDAFYFFPVQSRAFLWENGAMQDLGTLGTGTDAFAYFINERGQIAGASFTNTTVNPVLTYCTFFQIPTPTQDPFVWDNGKLIDLGSLGGTCGVPNAMNNKGQVVGLSDVAGDVDYHAFLWPGKNGKMQDLGTLGGCCALANWISDAGQVVGGSYTANQYFHAFLWKQGVMSDLSAGSSECSFALGVNSNGQAVGFTCGGRHNALLWENGQEIDLNVFNQGSSLKQLVLAYNINDSGEIVGLGVPPGVNVRDVFNLGHTFALIPCSGSEIEGCVELPQSLPSVPEPSRQLPPSTLPQRGGRHRRLVLSHDTKDLLPDTLDGVRPPCFRCTCGCGGAGYCLVYPTTGKLDGTCIGSGSNNMCAAKSNTTQCPVGAKPIRPSSFSCSIFTVDTVDVARRCTD